MTTSNEPDRTIMPAPAATAAAPGPAGRWAGWCPWHGPARGRDLLIVAAIGAAIAYAMAMIPLTPALIASHPVLLEMLAGSNPSVMAAAAFAAVNHHPQPAVVVAAALPSMMRSDWILWWAGRRWGRRFVGKLASSPRAAARVDRVQRRGVRLAAPLVAMSAFLPGGTQTPVYAAAGWLGLPLFPFLIADAIGTTAWVTVLTVLGSLLGGNGVAMAGLVSRYALLAVCLPVLTMVAPHAWRAWRQRASGARAGAPLAVATSETAPPGDG